MIYSKNNTQTSHDACWTWVSCVEWLKKNKYDLQFNMEGQYAYLETKDHFLYIEMEGGVSVLSKQYVCPAPKEEDLAVAHAIRNFFFG